jgi:hypothetical protein
MKFIKPYQKFTQISESSGRYEYILYTACDENYGYLNMIAADLSDYEPGMGDSGPCNYSMDDFIISEDDENRQKRLEFIESLVEEDGRTAEEIALAQNPEVNVEDEDDVDWEVEQYFSYEIEEWEEEVKREWIDNTLDSDLWGSIYYIQTRKELRMGEEVFSISEGEEEGRGTMSKKEFEEKILSSDERIIEFTDISRGSQSPKEAADFFLEIFHKKPDVVAKIFRSLPNDIKEELIKIASQEGIDIKPLSDIADIGLF